MCTCECLQSTGLDDSGLEGHGDCPCARSHLLWIFALVLQTEEITIIALALSSPLTNYNLSQLVVGGQAVIMEEAVFGT